MAEQLSTEKFEMPGFGSKSPLGKEGFTPVKPKSIVSAEEKEVEYTMEQDYLIWQEAKANNDITEADIQQMSDYYESKGII